jgi:hypothetical protein
MTDIGPIRKVFLSSIDANDQPLKLTVPIRYRTSGSLPAQYLLEYACNPGVTSLPAWREACCAENHQ